MSNEKIDILKKTEIFSSFREEELKLIAENSGYHSLKKDEILFQNNDPSNTLYVVASGEISILKYGENNSVTEIARFMEGHCFGELNFLTGSPRNAVARCEEDANLLCFPEDGKNFEDVLKVHPAASAKILHHLLVMVAGRLRLANSLIKENSPIMQELKKQVYIDKMTGIYNKTYMEEKLSSLLSAKPEALSYLSIKPDNFKDINDTYGHEAGDEAIKMFARGIKKLVDNEEIVSRYMGNEVTILLNGYDKNKALEYAKEIKEKIMKFDFSPVTQGNPFKFTISIGIAVYPEHSNDMNELIAKARELPIISRKKGGDLILFPEGGEK
jgi:diguanylate cyclase